MSSIPSAATEANPGSSVGFPPVARADARVLVLGSLPGRRSLEERQYYAHPQNAFWHIMGELVAADGDYETRCKRLLESRIALWDVLASSVRPGSMDADIDRHSAVPNDFAGFLASHPGIDRIGFNGRKAAELFGRLVEPGIDTGSIEMVVLPSTSPAFASMRPAGKLAHWRAFLDGAVLNPQERAPARDRRLDE